MCSQIQLQIQLHDQRARDVGGGGDGGGGGVLLAKQQLKHYDNSNRPSSGKSECEMLAKVWQCDCRRLCLIIRVQICCVGVASVPAKVTQINMAKSYGQPPAGSNW